MSELISLKTLEKNSKEPNARFTSWVNKIIHAALEDFVALKAKISHLFQSENDLSLAPSTTLLLEKIDIAPEPSSDVFDEEKSIGGLGRQLYRVEFTNHAPVAPMLPPTIPTFPLAPITPITPTEDSVALIAKIESAIVHEQQKLSILSQNSAKLDAHITLVQNHLLKSIITVQRAFEDFLQNKAEIEPILSEYKTYSWFEYVVTKIDAMLKIFQPETCAQFLNISPQTHIRDILYLKNMISEYDDVGKDIHHKAHQLVVDIASKIVGSQVENYATAESILATRENEIADLQNKSQYFHDLEKAIQKAHRVESFFDKVHTLHECTTNLVKEFASICEARGLLRDIHAQIEGRNDNIAQLEAEHQKLIVTLQQDNAEPNQLSHSKLCEKDLFSDHHPGYLNLSASNKSPLSYPHAQIQLEIPGFCAQQQSEPTAVL